MPANNLSFSPEGAGHRINRADERGVVWGEGSNAQGLTKSRGGLRKPHQKLWVWKDSLGHVCGTGSRDGDGVGCWLRVWLGALVRRLLTFATPHLGHLWNSEPCLLSNL